MVEKNLDSALAFKQEGNECYKKNEFEAAIEHYKKAINVCPPEKLSDLSVMHQNMAATNERLERLEEARRDCDNSLKCNNRYVKALDRRAKVLRKLAGKLKGGDENLHLKIEYLRQALEDMSMCSQLIGYRQDQIMFVDELLRELGSAEAVVASKNRIPDLPSAHTILQYFTSFTQDPFMSDEEGSGPYFDAKNHYKKEEFEKIIEKCDEEINQTLPHSLEAKLTKATFLVLSKQHEPAMQILNDVVKESDEKPLVKVNALIKRGALHIQKCQDPVKDAEASIADFDAALVVEPESADVFMNRGQVKLLLDRFDEAVSDLSMACKIRPDFALAHVQKLYTDFLAAQQTGNQSGVSKVVEEFESALDKFPQCVEAFALYAKILQEKNELEKSDEMYLKGIHLNPKNGNLVIHRALLKLQKDGDVDHTIAEIHKAIQIDDKNEFAFETLGQIEMQRENFDAAAQNFDKAIPLVNTELEMAHLFGLRDTALAKLTAKKKLSEVPSGMQDVGLD